MQTIKRIKNKPCQKGGFDLTACEISETYFEKSKQNILNYFSKLELDHNSLISEMKKHIEVEEVIPIDKSVKEKALKEEKAIFNLV